MRLDDALVCRRWYATWTCRADGPQPDRDASSAKTPSVRMIATMAGARMSSRNIGPLQRLVHRRLVRLRKDDAAQDAGQSRCELDMARGERDAGQGLTTTIAAMPLQFGAIFIRQALLRAGRRPFSTRMLDMT